MNDQKIIVIGSGPSGIATATKLIEFGYQNIVILEAENYVGGRICTIPFGENVVDLGAQWCHGEKGNIVYEIAKNYQDDIFGSTGVIYRDYNCIKSNKTVLSQELTAKLSAIINECLKSNDAEKEMAQYKQSYGDFLTKRFNDVLQKPEYADVNKITAKQFLDFYQKFECSIEASDSLFDVSTSGLLSYWECEGDLVLNWKGKGYITILKILMKSTEDKPYGILENKILLNKKVEEISWEANDEGKVYVRCTNGEKIFADHIICTVSLGVLKERFSTLFNPSLPQPKLRAIEGLSIGNVDKMFIEFPHPFWPDNWTGMCLLWEDDDLKMIRERSDNWIEDVFGFYRVDMQPNVLCGWIVGPNGRRMEVFSEEDVLNSLLFLLRKFLPWDIPTPKSFKRSTWYLNSNFRGSYSFRSMRTEELNTSAADLAYPLTTNAGVLKLQFAGEATHDHYYSTVHGAIESGLREAKRLNDFYTNRRNSKINHCDKQFSSSATMATNGNDSLLTNETVTDSNIFDIIVLGAGLAGLGAGLCLKQYQQQANNSHSNATESSFKPLKFIILEAQDYVGGRVRTVHMHSSLSQKKIHNFNDNSNNSDTSSTNQNYNGCGKLTNNGDGNNHYFSNIIDSGAQWLHGEQNKLYKIAKEYDLLHTELSEEGLGSYICENGEVIDDFFQKKIDFKIGQILEECENFIKHKDQTEMDYLQSLPESVGHFFDKKFYEYLQNEFDTSKIENNNNKNDNNNDKNVIKIQKEKIKAIKLYDWHKRFQIIDNSCLNLNELSSKYWGMYSFNGESCQAHINFKNGFSTIINALKNNIIGNSFIKTNTEICDINWNIIKNDIENDDDEDNDHKNLITIRTCDKRVYYAKHIIVTFSLGVLKSLEHKLFTPKLPKQIRNAIQCIGFNTINKIFLQFDHEWWYPMKGIQLLFDNDVNGDTYKNSKWIRYLSGFDILSPGSPNTLVGWVGSYGAIEMENLTDEEIIQDCLDVLTKFTKRKVPHPIKYFCSRWNSNKFIRGGYSYLSTKCEKFNITGKILSHPITFNDLKKPISIHPPLISIKTQANNTNDSGNCTNTCNDDGNSNENGEDISTALNKCYLTSKTCKNDANEHPLILFAGEACHDKYFSTAHGAFESGYEQAQKLLKFHLNLN